MSFEAFFPTKVDHNQNSFKHVRKEWKKEVGGQDEHYNYFRKDDHNKDGCFKQIGYPEW